jgi:hypothetical protein
MYTPAVTITLAPDGSKLTVKYSEAPEPGGERFFHYVVSIQSKPRLITGHSPYSVDTEYEIDYAEIPGDVVREARRWLKSNLTIAKQESSLARLLSQYLTISDEEHG